MMNALRYLIVETAKVALALAVVLTPVFLASGAVNHFNDKPALVSSADLSLLNNIRY